MFVAKQWDDSLIGRKVERSSNWTCGNQDGGPGNIGEIIGSAGPMRSWCQVKWPSGSIYSYPLHSVQFADAVLSTSAKEVRSFYDIAEIAKAMQKHIPGYTYGCEVECVKLPHTKGDLKIGTRFKTNTNIKDLEFVLKKFAEGASCSAICPDNIFKANYESGCLQAVSYKPIDTTPKAPAESPTLDFDKDNFVVEVITKEDGPEAIAFIKSLGIDTKNYEGLICRNNVPHGYYFYGCINGKFNNYRRSDLDSSIKIVRYPGQTSHLPSQKSSQPNNKVDYESLTLNEAEKEMRRFIPGFYIGCTLEIVRNTGYTKAYLGNRFSTKDMSLERLKSALKDFSDGRPTPGIDPKNTYLANYLPEDLKVVDPKVADPEEDYYVSVTPKAEAGMKTYADDSPLTIGDYLAPPGFIMGIDPYLPKEESKDKPDSSFKIEFVNSQLRKSGKKSKINF